MKSLGLDKLSVDERLALVEEIWDSIAVETDTIPLTDAQRIELERRYQDSETHPDDVVSWSEVRTSVLALLKN